MRSGLFIPADSEHKLGKIADCGADFAVLDLEDSVHPDRKQAARELLTEYLSDVDTSAPNHPRLYVRINALDTGMVAQDLEAVLPGGPDGILQPKANTGDCVKILNKMMTDIRQEADISHDMPDLMVLTTETAISLFHMHTFTEVRHLMVALTWGAEDLSAELGALTNRDENGEHTAPYQLARSLCLAAASAAKVQPVDTVYPDFRNEAGLRRDCLAAVRDGFTAKIAIHPAQVAVINEIFTPSTEDVAKAQAIVQAFVDAPQSGVVSIDGEMYDIPHLTRAHRLLSRV